MIAQTEDDLVELAHAVRAACEEHGRPNSFSPGELAGYCHGGRVLTPIRIGRLCRLGYFRTTPEKLRDKNTIYACDLWERLGGREGWGTCPIYDALKRRLLV